MKVGLRLASALPSGVACAVAPGLSCGPVDYGDPSPSVAFYERDLRTDLEGTTTAILVVDDRPSADAARLRAGLGDAIREIGFQRVIGSYARLPDPATWHPIDLRIAVVGASASSSEMASTPLDYPELAWTTVQATNDGAERLAGAVDARVAAMTMAVADAPFHPLELAYSMFDVAVGQRTPEGHVEGWLSSLANLEHPSVVAIGIVAASDDESPEPPDGYNLAQLVQIQVGDVATPGRLAAGYVGPARDPDPALFPRLSAWRHANAGGIGACFEAPQGAYSLLEGGLCLDPSRTPQCTPRPIAEASPGIGICDVWITTPAHEGCPAIRGWADPVNQAGVPASVFDEMGNRICEAKPVDERSLNACVHDPTCADCTSGYCITEVTDWLDPCPPSQLPFRMRWIGGVLGDNTSVHVACREDSVRVREQW